jgi:hypothetical protein
MVITSECDNCGGDIVDAECYCKECYDKHFTKNLDLISEVETLKKDVTRLEKELENAQREN